jgi:ADP-L-glycero-D-manno-heptose 6-epimerase
VTCGALLSPIVEPPRGSGQGVATHLESTDGQRGSGEMIVVTGGAGFIGGNLCRTLAGRQKADVVVVDNVDSPVKLQNIEGLPLTDLLNPVQFIDILRRDDRWAAKIEAVIHQGACTDTRETDWRYIFATNVRFSKLVLNACLSRRTPLIYASSAAVYGLSRSFREEPENEQPRGFYAASKALFDRRVRNVVATAGSPVVGLRYFNVYGTGEAHKGPMASLIYQLHEQVRISGRAVLFGGLHGCPDGEQQRDFIAVEDVVRVTIWFLEHAGRSGIFNVGAGVATSFNTVANLVTGHHGYGTIEYVRLPAKLRNSYQTFTQADLQALRMVGYPHAMTDPVTGILAYLCRLSEPRKRR